MHKFIVIILSLTLSNGFTICNNEENPVVTIKNGQIRGTIEYTRPSQKPYHAFRGIPFAQPPLGSLRFSAPVPAENWDGILNTTDYGQSCIQVFGVMGSEDCLYLNVFIPDNKSKSLPVMVWIYGGGFIMGTSTMYPPDNFIEEDVILVTINYRLGVFGFMTTNDDVVPGNSGLKDQILALKWVQNNIEAFGGDPTAVTIFGESAGSVSVSYLLQTPLTTGLFRTAIMQSGTSLNLWSLARNKMEAVIYLANLLNINYDDSQTMIDTLRKVDANLLAFMCNIVETTFMGLDNPLNGLLFSLSVEPDMEGAVVTGRSYEKLERGDFQQVPTIVGVNSNEAIAFISAAPLFQIYLALYGDGPSKFTPIDMNVDLSKTAEVGKLISDNYFPSGIEEATIAEIIDFVSEHQFEKSILKTAELQSKHAPTYMYYFSYYENNTHSLPGASHGDELNYLWNYKLKDHPLSKKIIKLWANFAKTSIPTPEADPNFDNVIWKTFDDNNNYLNIGDNLENMSEDINERISFWNQIYKEYGNAPYDTY